MLERKKYYKQMDKVSIGIGGFGLANQLHLG